MRQKKNVRSAKVKKTTTKNKMKKGNTALTLTEKMERDFRDAPANIVAQYRKDITVAKQQEDKLKVELKKADTLKKALETKITILAAKKPGATNKKQLANAKKMQVQLSKAISDFTGKLELIKELGRTLSAKQAIFAALGKQLAKLEKELTIKARNAAKAKSAPKTKKAVAKKTKSAPTPAMEEETQTKSSVMHDETETDTTVEATNETEMETVE